LDRKLGGPQSRSGRGGEEKNFQPLPGLEPPVIQSVAQRYNTERKNKATVRIIIMMILIINNNSKMKRNVDSRNLVFTAKIFIVVRETKIIFTLSCLESSYAPHKLRTRALEALYGN
jgi:hypothetical protein